MLELHRCGGRVVEGVHRLVEVEGCLGTWTGDGEQPLEDARFFRGSCRAQALSFGVPVSRQLVIAWMEHFVEDIVHGLHQIVPCSVIGSQVNVPFTPTLEAFPGDGWKVRNVLFVKPDMGVRG